ncbi:hypothetical protein [Rhizobium rhododendri]|uniref:Uncharacterized protein n=1 Tax=Rhizobium rhododendri TaxID=2506430 RepID=A0ABY8IQ30_9HYPH|nr:hypothetical protein [Rhizobium rhododendri]WFS25145.1 hypothetical protein PR018_23010 [Rhizobium rhododendri]
MTKPKQINKTKLLAEWARRVMYSRAKLTFSDRRHLLGVKSVTTKTASEPTFLAI